VTTDGRGYFALKRKISSKLVYRFTSASGTSASLRR
jgi:hypothetical protein